jgi:hypothetical protein
MRNVITTAGLKVHTAVDKKGLVFWDVTSLSLVNYTTLFPAYFFYNFHNFVHYPSSCLLFKNTAFRRLDFVSEQSCFKRQDDG